MKVIGTCKYSELGSQFDLWSEDESNPGSLGYLAEESNGYPVGTTFYTDCPALEDLPQDDEGFFGAIEDSTIYLFDARVPTGTENERLTA